MVGIILAECFVGLNPDDFCDACCFDFRNFSFEKVHVEGGRRLARLAREAGVERFIHVSALNATEHPKRIMLPGGSKWLASKVSAVFLFSASCYI